MAKVREGAIPMRDDEDDERSKKKPHHEFDGSSRFDFENARVGDPKAFERLLDRYRPKLTDLAQSLLGPHLARLYSCDDLVQQAFVVFVRNIDRLDHRGPGTVYVYLATVMQSIARDWGRRAGLAAETFGTMSPMEEAGNVAASGPGPATEVGDRDLANYVRDRIMRAKLPTMYRDILIKIHVENRSREDVAKERGVDPATFRKQLQRAQDAWRKLFED